MYFFEPGWNYCDGEMLWYLLTVGDVFHSGSVLIQDFHVVIVHCVTKYLKWTWNRRLVTLDTVVCFLFFSQGKKEFLVKW